MGRGDPQNESRTGAIASVSAFVDTSWSRRRFRTCEWPRSLDLREKRDISEALGVDEYLAVDLARDVVIVHRLDPAGAYAVSEHAEGTVTPRPAPVLKVPVAELLADSSGEGAGHRGA